MAHGSSEERRVQRLGTSSLIVTLPKKWVKRVGLKPGDTVIVELKDHYLIIRPKNFEDEISTFELSVDNIPEDTLLKIIKCLYFINYKKIVVDLNRLKATTVNKLILTLRDLPGTEHEITDNKIIIYIENIETHEKIIKLLSRLIENLTLILSSVEEYLDKGVKKELVIDTRNLLDESLKAYNDITRAILQDSSIIQENNEIIKRLLYELISKDLWTLTKIALRTIETLHSIKIDLPQDEAAMIINNIIQILLKIKKYILEGSGLDNTTALLDRIREASKKLSEKSPYIYSKAETFTEILSNIIEHLQCLEAIRLI